MSALALQCRSAALRPSPHVPGSLKRLEASEARRPGTPPAPRRSSRAHTWLQPTVLAAASRVTSACFTPVRVRVPATPLQFGEQLRLVGACTELGGWDAASAPLLQWQEGDNWVATLSLPPGEHACKLVLVRLDGSLHWEDGDDRALPVPATEGGAEVMASLRYGNTASTHVEVPQQPAEVAAARVAALQQRTRRLSAQMDALENEVAQRPAASERRPRGAGAPPAWPSSRAGERARVERLARVQQGPVRRAVAPSSLSEGEPASPLQAERLDAEEQKQGQEQQHGQLATTEAAAQQPATSASKDLAATQTVPPSVGEPAHVPCGAGAAPAGLPARQAAVVAPRQAAPAAQLSADGGLSTAAAAEPRSLPPRPALPAEGSQVVGPAATQRAAPKPAAAARRRTAQKAGAGAQAPAARAARKAGPGRRRNPAASAQDSAAKPTAAAQNLVATPAVAMAAPAAQQKQPSASSVVAGAASAAPAGSPSRRPASPEERESIKAAAARAAAAAVRAAAKKAAKAKSGAAAPSSAHAASSGPASGGVAPAPPPAGAPRLLQRAAVAPAAMQLVHATLSSGAR